MTTFSELLVKLGDDFSFAFLPKIVRSMNLKVEKNQSYAIAKIMIPIEINKDLRNIRNYTIFLGWLPKDKFEKEISEAKEVKLNDEKKEKREQNTNEKYIYM